MYHRTIFLGSLVSITAVAVIAAWSFGQMNDVGAEPVTRSQARVAAFFEAVSTTPTSPERAYQDLLQGSPLASRKAALDTLVARTKELESRYGKYQAFELIDTKRIGTDVVVLKYLYKCELFPVVWYFTLYRDQRAAAASAWSIVAVRFDTDVELLAL